MAKRFFVFLTVYFLAAFPVVAYADIILEVTNDFYDRHINEWAL